MTLIDAADSILIVIDVQPIFLDKLPRVESEQIVNRICWLVRLANWREIPLIVTAEEYEQHPLATSLLATPPINSTTFRNKIFNKMVFGLADDHAKRQRYHQLALGRSR